MKEDNQKIVAIWLLICCVMIFCMVIIGGLTRLTDSGLSMTNWHPIHGAIPPLDDKSWLEEFESYRKSPEYNKINYGMTVDEFKEIFWLEFIHRLFGRITGIVFLIPLIYFIFTKKVTGKICLKLTGIFLLGGLQGLIGWWMVKSGLKDSPHVSPVWLAFHMGSACFILGLTLSMALGILFNKQKVEDKKTKNISNIAFCAVFLQIILGALVAGLDAGLIYNSFPDMNGKMIPDDIWISSLAFYNFFENPALVQFNHRIFAYITTAIIIYLWWNSKKHKSLYIISNIMLITIIAQVAIGILTLIHSVPIYLASIHQAVAVLLFAMTLGISRLLCSQKMKS
ncbi:COX15/CtaA family protein [Rickettsiales bacterium]|nr:COX15/CtaA family protein [Rickettsiales bacterium]